MTASPVSTGATDGRDVAELWRLIFTWLFYIHVCLGIIPMIAGLLLCAGNFASAVGFILLLFSGIAFVFKSIFFWWAAVLRLSTEGKVAAGKLIDECKEKILENQEVDKVPEVEEPAARLLDELLDGDEVSDIAAIDLSICNNYNAFQIRGGKLLLVWIVFSIIKCI